ncbi:MFP1 attachment factor 1 [Camellia lanceoleosa]|uniref:MFP1 attachment factor 1 n=1 Tax=Camellia lanceoleosa TaxID=1840588 RepID=A0ACC0HQT5_9ERIC|nr:MFP1 attachment factor 1 [Camellia lanceoleosa]
MSDNTEETNVALEQQQEEPPTMADTEPQTHHHEEPKKPEKMANKSFSIWPPSQRTRDAVVNRLIETLSAPSVLSKRYGSMSHDDADATAHRIEDEAFVAASASASADDDGIEILQIYSKEISKRMLDAAKSRSAPGPAPNNTPPSTPLPPPVRKSHPLSIPPTTSEKSHPLKLSRVLFLLCWGFRCYFPLLRSLLYSFMDFGLHRL